MFLHGDTPEAQRHVRDRRVSSSSGGTVGVASEIGPKRATKYDH